MFCVARFCFRFNLKLIEIDGNVQHFICHVTSLFVTIAVYHMQYTITLRIVRRARCDAMHMCAHVHITWDWFLMVGPHARIKTA